MKRIQRLAMAACGLGVATAVIGSGIAVADPNPANTGFQRPLQGMGSDTTEEVMNDLSETITGTVNGVDNTKLIASWNALGGSLKTRATGCSYGAAATGTYVVGNRANGSGNGVRALGHSITGATNAAGDSYANCLDFARSSSSNPTSIVGNTNTYTFIPFAKDAVSFAVTKTSNLPKQLTYADLKAMYSCTYPGFDGPNPQYKALIPQSGSGTRSFWLGAMGLADNSNATNGILNGNYKCLSDQTTRNGLGGTSPLQEHRAVNLDDNSIVPFSIAQYIAQFQDKSTSYIGDAVLGAVKSDDAGTSVSYPISLNVGYGNVSTNTTLNAPLTRDVYNVVPKASITSGDAKFNQTAVDVFVGSTSKVCQQQATILKNGFGVISNCGDTTLVR